MASELTLCMAQINPLVGDVRGNLERCIEAVNTAREEHGARVVVLPELILCGYPPEDLLFHRDLERRIGDALEALRVASKGIAIIVGAPDYAADNLYNAAFVFDDGVERARYHKHLLPNYQVFDEKRYFTAGSEPCVVDIDGVPLGVTICEDVWEAGPCESSAAAGAEVIVALNGSPYALGAQSRRESVVAARARSTGKPHIYVNMVGGQDELVFDGGSFAMDASGEVIGRAPACVEAVIPVSVQYAGDSKCVVETQANAPIADDLESIYEVLVAGTRDYVRKNGFPGVLLGLSGGIDSALTLCIAVDALGADVVRAVMMPYHYTSEMSRTDAAEQARRLDVDYDVISIEPIVTACMHQLEAAFRDTEPDASEENIQSRARCIVLMALSNKTGRMLLTTGNKSEMAVGYATLYGDMAGGFAPIKDCSKSQVFALARWRNAQSPDNPPIPQRVIDRPPSAELRPDQEDTDSLPPYDVLDPILEGFIERDLSVRELVELGFDRDVVVRILSMVRRNEYKRRQAPPGVRVSGRAFGRDWRYPITSGYHFPGD
ncbi:MAG: NAD+ synthase [Pseudomonadota bacterium]